MTSHIKSELSMLSELILSILLTACIAIFLFKYFETFPWLPFIGIPIGIAIILACWEKKKHRWNMLTTGLILNSLIWSIALNWSSVLKIFH